MPNKVLKKYNSFSREILAELLPEWTLKELDKVYSNAKTVRVLKKYGKKVETVSLTN